jgi:hypothetical protein
VPDFIWGNIPKTGGESAMPMPIVVANKFSGVNYLPHKRANCLRSDCDNRELRQVLAENTCLTAPSGEA